jgi:hypothetical protein
MYSYCIFTVGFALLVEEVNQCYQQHLDYLNNRPSVPDVTESEIFVSSNNYSNRTWHMTTWKTSDWPPNITEQKFSPFYTKTIRHDRNLHIFRFLHSLHIDAFLNNNDLKYENMETTTYFPFPECWILEILHPFRGKDNLQNFISREHMSGNKSLYIVWHVSFHIWYEYLCRERQNVTAHVI